MMPARPKPWAFMITIISVMGLMMWAGWQIDLKLSGLLTLETWNTLWSVIQRFLTPSLKPEVLIRVGDAALTTLALATCGSLIAVIIAILLAPFACESLSVRQPLVVRKKGLLSSWSWMMLHHSARLIANILRTTPYLVWALILMLVCGLGPAPAAIALGLHTGGVLTRLFAGVFDANEQTPVRALQQTGAGRLGTLLFAVLPQSRAQLVSLSLYRWEINLREATVLGLLAAGGLGHELAMAFGQFKYQTMVTVLIAIIILVCLGEFLSSKLRRRWC
jgi:phosphonate transport system permease protein